MNGRFRSIVGLLAGIMTLSGSNLGLAESDGERDRLAQASGPSCPAPVLSRLVRHRVAAGETLNSIAQRYNLIPATLMGINPSVRSGKAAVGSQLLIPPYNGIRVELSSSQTLRQVAKQYGVRSDVLFELNGCQQNPKAVFIPGVNWSPIAAASTTAAPVKQILAGSPLPTKLASAAIILGYGWGIQPTTGQVAFHTGLDVAAAAGSPVLAVGDGTVAFASSQGSYGNLIVINHSEGLQTRYAQLNRIQVKVGQTVKRGQTIGTVGSTGRPSSTQPHLHLEVRSRSNVGWVAENPESYLLPGAGRPNRAGR